MRQVPLRRIASETKTSIAALHRHKAHIPAKLATAEHASKIAEASSLLNGLEQVIEHAKRITARAERKGNYNAALAGLRTITSSLELLGRVTGELRTDGGGLHLHKHQHLHATASEPGALSDFDLEIEIARDVATATNNFDASEIARLKSLIEDVPALPAPGREAALIEA
ncbi:MAG: hypothetical protein WAK21_14405 [Candidatus Sulfotelmatobacter sp.]